jgi:predicted nucleic acid-binding protein
MSRRAFFDTNVLVYALLQDDPRTEIAHRLLAQGGFVSVQVLNEFADVARRKFGWPWSRIGEALGAVRQLCYVPVPMTVETHSMALALAAKLHFRIYDALIVASALSARCATLFTEDLRNGQVIEGGLTVQNPF